ncbi:hypothetical protein FE783_26900 [Paenibacillus mesophilus]|uniref:hypothetical protein n=1 Tax=Paenibacillus mesophilus TaxID=2582849 RepID=UPI00110EB668|nr:hypothetical protein [Paenibacillus mesophilus]TMV46316.1 hypothetical protein FE783_26900 [Paenibacillus mesophilus]
MVHKIDYIGVGSSRKVGHLELLADGLKITMLDGEEMRIQMKSLHRSEYLYSDYIENRINGYNIVCHLVKANGELREVLNTLFLRSMDEYNTIANYLTKMKDMNEPVDNKPKREQRSPTNKGPTGGGWLSRRK